MQFGLRRAAAFVSSPIHLFHLRRSQDGWAPRQCPPLVCTESNNLLQGSHTQAHVWTVFGHLPSGQVPYPVTCPPVNRPLVHTQYITIYNDTWPGMGGKWPTVSLSSSSSVSTYTIVRETLHSSVIIRACRKQESFELSFKTGSVSDGLNMIR